MKDSYPPGRWDPPPPRWPPGPSGDAWNQSWGQESYAAGLSPTFSYGWQNYAPRRPISIQIAVALMSVGAALDGLSVILNLMRIGGHAIDGGSGIVGSAIGAALWAWMALANRAGKRWARITATVFFGIETLSVGLLLLVIHELPHLAARIGASGTAITAIAGFALVVSLAIWFLGLTIIVLLWRRESSAYYAAMSAYS